MRYKIKICHRDIDIGRILHFQGILVEADSLQEALKKAYDGIFVEEYKELNLPKNII